MGGLILHIIRHNKLYNYNLCAFPLVYYTSVKITVSAIKACKARAVAAGPL